ncbi:MAG: hypothetical protein FJ271_11390 [Planctomycetes bacterium]|nr:hypothetical protein [Planctomycetota bacterium]
MRPSQVSTWLLLGLPMLLFAAGSAIAGELPPGLPRYDLDIKLDPARRLVEVRQHVVWTNKARRPTGQAVLNVHSHYSIPDKDVGFLAKTVEILRLAPSESLSFDGPACSIQDVELVAIKSAAWAPLRQAAFQEAIPLLKPKPPPKSPGNKEAPSVDEPALPPRTKLPHRFRDDRPTTLVIDLPRQVGPGESVAFELTFKLDIPQKMGRWGTWGGVTVLAQWLPVMSFYDDQGWQDVPFIPWHQPYFNEAGIFTAKIVLPTKQKLACTGTIESDRDLGDGWRELRVGQVAARDFSMVCSERFQEHTDMAGRVKVRCLALPEHEFYAKEMVKVACEAIPAYEQWFGPYPYPEFDLVEAYFGWNGNECGGMVMIDQRIFSMPHAGRNYIDYLVSHEICHQWWYNVVGTNGYAETWMDEGLATYFSHRLTNQKLGQNNQLLTFPKGLSWLPNINREDFRSYGMMGVVARGQAKPVVQPMEKFDNLVNLMGMTYDRGSRIVGMIEERMGEANFMDFMKQTYKKHQFGILRVADFQKELEEYTGRSWDDFFRGWLYSTGMSEWSVDKVDLSCPTGPRRYLPGHCNQPTRATIHLTQNGECNEPTVLGFRLVGDEGYQVRVPIFPELPTMEDAENGAHVESIQEHDARGKIITKVKVDITLPKPPSQISVDPDHVLIDSNLHNNHWQPECRWRFTPLYTQLEETDVTAAYDRWNFIFGPWFYGSSYNNPWFTRSAMVGARAGAYRTQEFDGGAYVALRSNDRNIIAGVDAQWEHLPWANTQLGLIVEQNLATLGPENIPSSRAVAYGRYIFLPGTSLYLPPFEHLEVFAAVQNRNLPLPNVIPPGARLFNEQAPLGIHYHKYLLTPYWDPEGGYALDLTYEGGLPVFTNTPGFNMAFGQFSFVKTPPRWARDAWDNPAWNWLTGARWAFRVNGAMAVPSDGLFFSLGGGDNFRGFGLNQRQGSATWVASAEWRLPVFQNVNLDMCDHFARLRTVYMVPFYDVGNAYFRWNALGPLAQAVGVGLRLDVTWVGLIERTMLRLDVAQSVSENAPTQFWFGVQHPF